MADDNSSEANLSVELSKSFDAILLQDVIDGLRRAQGYKSQGVKRDLIRTMFAAIEGSVWGFRQHVRSIAESVGELTTIMDMAFSESTYFVSETGKLEQQTRFISLTAMIRLTACVAQQISSDLQLDFGSKGWAEFQQAIAIRNRITHPKSIQDLEITDNDIALVTRSLFWLLEMIQHVMETTNLRAATYLKSARNLLAQLVSGDEVASSTSTHSIR